MTVSARRTNGWSVIPITRSLTCRPPNGNGRRASLPPVPWAAGGGRRAVTPSAAAAALAGRRCLGAGFARSCDLCVTAAAAWSRLVALVRHGPVQRQRADRSGIWDARTALLCQDYKSPSVDLPQYIPRCLSSPTSSLSRVLVKLRQHVVKTRMTSLGVRCGLQPLHVGLRWLMFESTMSVW